MGSNKNVLIVGCGLSGSVCARELAENGYQVTIWDRRSHVGGNMYDYYDDYGIPIHKYGPHTFHTSNPELYEYMKKYCQWNDYKVLCGAQFKGICTPTPFNFKTIDDFYSLDDTLDLKNKLKEFFPNRETVTVVEILDCSCNEIREFGEFLFKHDYSLYTAKQWGISPFKIDASVLKRVPIRISYDEGYFTDPIQVMPKGLYLDFFENILNHPNIEIQLNVDALKRISLKNNLIFVDNIEYPYPVIYTGALDELFHSEYGALPYRSLSFEIKHCENTSFQKYSIVAYPEAQKYTRIVEYRKMYKGDFNGSTYVIEYPLQYNFSSDGSEPYYPIPTKESDELYLKYKNLASKVSNLYICGRLADYKYYNMDQALNRALSFINQELN